MSSSIFDGIKHNKEFEQLCKMTKQQLKAHLVTTLGMENGDGYAFKQGTFPVLLTAHMDTVHRQQCKKIKYTRGKFGETIVSSPVGIGGDDRCGIYMAIKIAKQIDCSILFCEDEEVGSIGAGKFVKTELCESLKGKFRYIIELDRMNANDAVFYDDDNEEFHQFITKEYWKENYGSWSDICTLSPALGISSVNLSCGYYKAHTTGEYVVLEEMEKSIEEIVKLLQRTDTEKTFEFVEAISKYYYGTYKGGRGSGKSYLFNDYDDYYWAKDIITKSSATSQIKKEDDKVYLEAILDSGEAEFYGVSPYVNTCGKTENEAWKNLFMENDWLCYSMIIDYYTY